MGETLFPHTHSTDPSIRSAAKSLISSKERPGPKSSKRASIPVSARRARLQMISAAMPQKVLSAKKHMVIRTAMKKNWFSMETGRKITI